MTAAALSILLLAAPSKGAYFEFVGGDRAYVGFDPAVTGQVDAWVDVYIDRATETWRGPVGYVHRASTSRRSKINVLYDRRHNTIRSVGAHTLGSDWWLTNSFSFDVRSGPNIGSLEMTDPHHGVQFFDGFPRYRVVDLVPGDVDLDGIFNSADLVLLFERGHFEDAVAENSSWTSGDFNDDLGFSTHDLVIAFEAGGYSAAAVPEPASHAFWLISFLLCVRSYSFGRSAFVRS